MKVQVLGNRVLVKVLREEMTSGGMYIPQQVHEKLNVATAEVIAVGDGVYNLYTGKKIPLRVEVGDHVMFFMDSAFPLKYKERDYNILAEDAICMILEKEKKEEKTTD